jgi:hypothetical protein
VLEAIVRLRNVTFAKPLTQTPPPLELAVFPETVVLPTTISVLSIMNAPQFPDVLEEKVELNIWWLIPWKR